MNWYDIFNTIEAGLWLVVAVVIASQIPWAAGQQRFAVILGSVAFVAFAMTDLLEVGRIRTFPLWLWGLKIACGIAIIAARYTWRGWNRFRWTDREIQFGITCLISVLISIALQRWLDGLAGTADW